MQSNSLSSHPLPVKGKLLHRFWAQAAAPDIQPSAALQPPKVQKPSHGVCGEKGVFNLEDAQSDPGWTQPLCSCPGYTEQFGTARLGSQHCNFLLIIFFYSFSVLFSHQACPSYGENYFLSMDNLWTVSKHFLHIWFLNCIINHVLLFVSWLDWYYKLFYFPFT